MTRIPTPIPAALVRTGKAILTGPIGSVAWRLLVLVLGAFIVIYLAAVNTSVIGYVLLFVLISFTLGSVLKSSVRDIWNANFWRFNL